MLIRKKANSSSNRRKRFSEAFRFLTVFTLLAGPSLSNGAEIVSASSHGDIETFDSETGNRVNYFYLPTPSGSGPAGVAFRGANTMFVTVDVGFGGDKVYEFQSSGEHSWREGFKFNQGNWADPLLSSASGITQHGSSGLMYLVGRASHDLWAITGTRVDREGNMWLAGNQVTSLRTETDRYPFPGPIESSPLDGRLAVGTGQKLRIYLGVTPERVIQIPGNIESLAFDAIGREVTNAQGQKEIHSLIYVATMPSDQARVERYDAVTGEPWGSDPANRANPVFIPAGTGGLAHYVSDMEIDYVTGDIYVAGANSHRRDFWGLPLNCLNRFDKDGTAKGLENNNTNAVLNTLFNSQSVELAVRPRFDTQTYSTKGSYTLGLTPGEAGFGLAGLNFVATDRGAGSIVEVTPSGSLDQDITIGGHQSAPIQVNVKQGHNLTVNNVTVAKNGTLEVQSGSTVEVNAIAALEGASRLNVVRDAVMKVLGNHLLIVGRTAELTGKGTIIAKQLGVLIRGILSPGASPGTLTIEGNLALTTGSELKIEIGGTEQGVSYDLVNVQNDSTGFVTVNGKLAVQLVEGFASQIQPTQEFNILNAVSAIGVNFQNVVSDRVITADGKGSFQVRLVNEGKTLQLTDYQPFTGSPYEGWVQNNFTASERADTNISGQSADPDQDGVNNLLEFAFNSDPKNGVTVIPAKAVPATGANFATLEFTRRAGGTGSAAAYLADGIKYQIQQSSDLQTWVPLSSEFTAGTSANNDGITETLRLNLANRLGAPAQTFYRLRVSAQ